MKLTTFSLLLMGSSMLACTPALAQPNAAQDSASQADQGTDIIVTAQRRAESVQKVPIGISIVGSDQLERQQVTQLSDLSRSSASVNFGSVGSAGGGGGGAYIRGIGTFSLSRAAESAVGVVVDGVVQGNTNINNLFDISRLEILRGPQGTLFGQSVSAGVINISTETPDPSRVSGKVLTELAFDGFGGSEYGRKIVRGAINLPVSPTSALRVSAFGGRTDGVLRNTYTNKDDNYDEAGVRARYKAEIGDNVTVNLIGDYNSFKARDGQFFTYIGASGAWPAILARCGIVAEPGNLEHCGSAIDRQRGKSGGVSGQVDIDLGGLSITSITAFRKNVIHVRADIDRTPAEYNSVINISSGVRTGYQQFTQELRVASDPSQPLSITAGAFYYNAKTTANQNPDEGAVTAPGAGTTVTALVFSQRTKSLNLSAFGEARYQVGDLTVFAGGRFNRSELDYLENRENFVLAPVTAPTPGTALSTDYGFNDNAFAWRLGGRYQVTQSVNVYGTISRGYKNAQLSPIQVLTGRTILQRVVLPEVPTAYEIGAKTNLFDGRLAFNINAFYQRVKNFQAQTLATLDNDPVPVSVPTNVSKVISKGLEADIFGRVGPYLTLNASAMYNVVKYPADYIAGDRNSLNGQQVAFAPRFSATVSSEYARPISGDIDGFVAFDLRHRSRTRLTDQSLAAAVSIDKGRWIAGGRIGARVNDSWSVALFANNLFGSRIPSVYNSILLGNPSAYYTTQALRQVGLQAQLEF